MPKVELYNIKSKKTGNDIECLKISLGVYETLVFPSKAEMEYIKGILRNDARQAFQDEEQFMSTIPLSVGSHNSGAVPVAIIVNQKRRAINDMRRVFNSNMYINEKNYTMRYIENLYKMGYYSSIETIFPTKEKQK